MSIGGKLWNTCIFLFMCVAVNADWKAKGSLWWGAIALLGGMFVVYNYTKENRLVNMPLVQLDTFTVWFVIFILNGLASVIYCVHADTVTTNVKTLIMCLLPFSWIKDSNRNRDEIRTVLIIYVFAALVSALYIVGTLGLKAFSDTRIGAASTGNWNANAVGVMMTVGALVCLYLIDEEKRGGRDRIHMLLWVCLLLYFVYLVVVTASRKALLMLMMGCFAYLFFINPNKRFRIIMITCMSMLVLYWALMEISFLYDLIGWRINGMIAAITGKGVVDGSSMEREVIRNSALETFLKHPLLGCGLDNFRYYNRARVTYAHNNMLEIAADLGLVGLITHYWIYLRIVGKYLVMKNRDCLSTMLFVLFLLYIIAQYAMVTYYDTTQILLILLCTLDIRHQETGLKEVEIKR